VCAQRGMHELALLGRCGENLHTPNIRGASLKGSAPSPPMGALPSRVCDDGCPCPCHVNMAQGAVRLQKTREAGGATLAPHPPCRLPVPWPLGPPVPGLLAPVPGSWERAVARLFRRALAFSARGWPIGRKPANLGWEQQQQQLTAQLGAGNSSAGCRVLVMGQSRTRALGGLCECVCGGYGGVGWEGRWGGHLCQRAPSCACCLRTF